MPIERLLPQRPPQLLLDRLLSCTPSEGAADTLVSPGNLFRLPDDVRCFPGHEGETTVGRERRTNPFVGDAAMGMAR